jgi:hypothetical protein
MVNVKVALLVLVLCMSGTLANIELPNDWVAPDYGVCTLPVIDPAEPGADYTGDNRNPLIAEGVGSGSHLCGSACNGCVCVCVFL